MCGIFAYLRNKQLYNHSIDEIKNGYLKGKDRGPEESNHFFDSNIFLGFHRLAINGLNKESSQPLKNDKILLICNGEIYNYKQLTNKLKENNPNFSLKTNSDCEIILYLYEQYGFETTLKLLDGVFGLVLYDFRNINTPQLFIARDPYGVRPLYQLTKNRNLVGVSSVMKMLSTQSIMKDNTYVVNQFTPGTYTKLNFSKNTNTWYMCYNKQYTMMPFAKEYNAMTTIDDFDFINIVKNTSAYYFKQIREHFIKGVEKRVTNSDRPIACLLSGGLDSSIVTSIVSKFYKEKNLGKLETYSIGIKGGEDLKYARIVAEFLDTKHTEIELTEQDFLNAIPEVIYAIESYDTTTVRASVGNYLIAKYISKHSNAKVIFNGDGSDELMGGYLYFHNAPNSIEFDKECRRLLSNIHYFDGLRSDRSISCHGLEPRTPFLDRSWVQYYLSIPSEIRFHKYNKKCEKYLFRSAFDCKKNNKSIFLPDEILWRTKEAFSDGVSKQTRSWYEIINEYVTTKLDNKTLSKINKLPKLIHNNPETMEQKYYRVIFNSYFENCDNTIPYFWMPKYSNAKDSSARTLKIYSEQNK